MKMPLVMSPGPTLINEEVRRALSRPLINPDLDPDFFEFYKTITEKIQLLLKTKNQVLVLSGEGILGLEAACASLIEPGDKVLCIDNGLYGKGFGDFASMYGGVVTYFSCDYRKEADLETLKNFLKEKGKFKIATMVHCETPSGLTNPVDKLCPLLKAHGIITVVDSVSGIAGENLDVDQWKIDIALGGSQKCLSAPPGLCFMSISDDAWNKILNRKTPIAGYYVNLGLWKNWYIEKYFPYTQPVNDLYALDASLDIALREGESLFEKHSKIGDLVRRTLVSAGLQLYPLNGFSNTVTAILVPEGIKYEDIFNIMLEEHNVLIAGSYGILKDKVFRIGHMGETCSIDKLFITLKSLDNTLSSLGVELKVKLHEEFSRLV
ncbi:MAG: pyridoxal-phosphate-dependent aminotransferase family protein [Solirubrobacterales bacterium]